MSASADVNVKLSLIDNLTAGMQRVQGVIDRVTSPVRRLSLAMTRIGDASGINKVAGSVRNLGGALHSAGAAAGTLLGVLGAASAGAAAFGVRGVIDTSAQFERFNAILESVLKSSAKAKTAMAWVSDFATKTPYELAEVTDGFVKLTSYGIDPMKGALESAGNVAAAMGKPLEQAIEALADAMTGENERLKEFGIKASKEGDKIKYTWAENGKEMTAFADANSRKQIEAVIKGIWNRQYSGSMDKLSRTWAGLMSNLSDQWARFNLMIGNAGAFDGFKSILQDLLSWVDRMSTSGQLQAWARSVSDALVNYLINPLKDFLFGPESIGDSLTDKFRSGGALDRLPEIFRTIGTELAAITAGFSSFYSAVKPALDYIGGPGVAALTLFGAITLAPLITALTAVATAAWGVGAALAATPIGWFLAGAAALGVIAKVVYDNWEPIAGFFSSVFASISSAVGSGVAFIVAKISGLGAAIASGFEEFGRTFIAFGMKFTEFYNRIASIDWIGLGKAIVQGIWSGMESVFNAMVGWLRGKIADLLSLIPEKLRAAVGLELPSVSAPAAPAAPVVPPPAVKAPEYTTGGGFGGEGATTGGDKTGAIQTPAVQAGSIQVADPILVREPMAVNVTVQAPVTINAQTQATAAEVAAAVQSAVSAAGQRAGVAARSELSD